MKAGNHEHLAQQAESLATSRPSGTTGAGTSQQASRDTAERRSVTYELAIRDEMIALLAREMDPENWRYIVVAARDQAKLNLMESDLKPTASYLVQTDVLVEFQGIKSRLVKHYQRGG